MGPGFYLYFAFGCFLTTISQHEYHLFTTSNHGPLASTSARTSESSFKSFLIFICRSSAFCSLVVIESSFSSTLVPVHSGRVGLNNVLNNVKISCHPASQPSASYSYLINLFRLHFDQRRRQTAANNTRGER